MPVQRTFDRCVILRLRLCRTRILRFDLKIVLPRNHGIWARQPLEICRVQVAQFSESNALRPTAAVAVEQMKVEPATFLHNEMMLTVLANHARGTTHAVLARLKRLRGI